MLSEEIEQEATIAAEIVRDSSQDSQSSASLSQDPLGGPIILNEAATAMDEVERAMEQAQEDVVNLEDLVKQLNFEQKQKFDEVTEQIEHGFSHEKKECSCTSFEPVRLYVSGEAGTGKSFLIKAISTYLHKMTESPLSCVVTAPTGLAAHNIKGITLHRLLMLPVEHDNKLQYHKLSGDACSEVSRVLKKMKLLIIDEVSMVSNLMLAFVHLRMQEILRTDYDVLFGGKHIIVFGDLLQLTPVKGQPVFKMLTHEDTRKCLGSIGNVNIWLNFKYAELHQNMRQAKDENYKSILQDIRIGKVTEHGKEALQTRLLSNLYPNENIVPEKNFKKINESKSGICLMPTLQECAIFNNNMLMLENEEIVKLEAVDKIEHMGATIVLSGNLKSKLDSLEKNISKTAGLEKTLNVCLHCRIILRRNLNVERGLVNGAMGHVVDFVKYRNREGIEFLQIKFDDIEEVQQISRCSARFLLVKDLYVCRKQFPVCLAYAVTIHKSQGLSVESALVNIGSSVFKEGMAYVALSRVKTLSGLYLIEWDETKISADLDCVKEYNRLRREYAPHLPQYPLFEKCLVGSKRKTVDNCSEVVAKRQKVDKTIIKRRKKKDSEEDVVGFQFENSSGVNCYANVVVNVVFFLKSLQEQIAENCDQRFCCLLNSVFEQCRGDRTKIESVSGIRELLDICSGQNQFSQIIQQDCQEFLMYMFGVLEDEGVDIKNLFNLSYQWQHDCDNCTFSSTTRIETERFIYLTLPDCKSVSFNKLVKAADHNMMCTQCKSAMLSTLFLQSYGQYVILVFQRCRPDGTKLTTSIKNVVASQLSISRRTFGTVGIIYHDGPSTTSGHYTCYLKSCKGWTLCNDTHLTFKQRLPFDLKNSYLVFLEPKSK